MVEGRDIRESEREVAEKGRGREGGREGGRGEFECGGDRLVQC